MRILITAGIFAPESGGPATYAPKLAQMLVGAGHNVDVLTFSEKAHYEADAAYVFKLTRIVRGGRILNRIRFFFAAWRHVQECDVIYTLDWFAVGLPISIVALILHKPYVVRVGGDYLWEQLYLESGAEPLALREFYARGLHRRLMYIPARIIIREVLAHARMVVFNSDVQRELYQTYYALLPERTATIYNPVPKLDMSGLDRGTVSHELVFAGRFIVMKNVTSLILAFARARLPEDYTLTIIGGGPQRQAIDELIHTHQLEARVRVLPAMGNRDMLMRIKDARAFILPSWTDVSPNQVCEALAIGLPVLVTKENYLSFRDQLPDTFDPHSIDDIAEKIEILADDSHYEEFARRFNAISYEKSWEDVLGEHIRLLKSL